MSFKIQSDQVNVEDVMCSIRTRIEERRQGGCSDEQVARVVEGHIERALDGVDFDTGLLAELRQRSWRWNFKIDGDTIYASTHDTFAGRLLAALRRRLNPVLRLLINPNPLVIALHRQSQLNTYYVHLLHQSTVELARLNLKLESFKAEVLDPTGRPEQMARREKARAATGTGATASAPEGDQPA
jgi:hypothetical protein